MVRGKLASRARRYLRRQNKKLFRSTRNLFLRAGLDLRRTSLRSLPADSPFFQATPSLSGTEQAKHCLVILLSGVELESLARNFLESLRSVRDTAPVLCYTFPSSLELAEQLRSEYKMEIVILSENESSNQGHYSSFGSESFNRLTNMKWDALLDAFTRGYEVVVYSDVDLVFIRGYADFIQASAKVYSCGLQSEARNVYPPQYCTGFMYFTREAIPLLNYARSTAAANNFRENDQVLFNEIVASNPVLLAQIHLLPEAVFMNGMQFSAFTGPRHEVQVHQTEPILFHANYVAGATNKEVLLRDAGLWSKS